MEQASTGLDVVGSFERLRDAFFRYYNTPFGLADEELQRERQDLLDQDNGVYRRPLIELRPEYTLAGHDLAASAAAGGAAPELADFAAAGLIPAGRQLYRHQEEALAVGRRADRNMVITAGTGSGKTESFLLPILDSLLEESRSWTGTRGPASSWWQDENGAFVPQRKGEVGRPQAVRAMILYPMNALVDDQLIRLRKALDSDHARAWLDANRNGHRFFFGRYTGATPVTGSPDDNRAVRDLRRLLRDLDGRSAKAQALGGETQYFMPRLGGAEMRSRWDMLDAPPDVLITNYSMLNVMLLRDRESAFFEQTRQWLQSDAAHRFTLVIDELHTYRGTAGTEVALLIRNLRNRLGLIESPGQLRVLAASASLDPARDRKYIQDFFGLDEGTFEFLQGDTVQPNPLRADISQAAEDLAGASDAKEALRVAEASGAPTALRSAFHLGADGRALPAPEAKDERQLEGLLFGQADSSVAKAALTNLLAAIPLSEDRPGWPRLRAHLFFRNVPGMWACTDPRCPDAPSRTTEVPTVGRLFAEPTTRCTCGARVLELLYCQNCGDVLLGGFVPAGETQLSPFRSLMLADVPDLAKMPDQVSLERTADNFLVYWPRTAKPELDDLAWDADGKKVDYAYRPSILIPASGEVRNALQGKQPTGWTFHVTSKIDRKTGRPQRDLTSLSPFPTRCPSCADDWEIRHTKAGTVPPTDPLRQRSPIRGMRTGFEKINQVLVTELVEGLDDDQRKAIVFTDSRQDAAKLSAGMGLRHYQDLLRLLVHERVAAAADAADDVAAAKRFFVDRDRTEETRQATKRLKQRFGAKYDRAAELWRDEDDEAHTGELAQLESELAAATPLSDVANQVGETLLSLGVNPGGPSPSLNSAHNGQQDPTPWSSLFDWTTTPARPRAGLGLTEQELLGRIDDNLKSEVIEGLFSGAGRDFESLGLGWLTLASDQARPDLEPASMPAIARSSLRVLGDLRRFFGLRDPRDKAHARLTAYWDAVARTHGLDPAEVASGVRAFWSDAVRDYLIDPARVTMRQPGQEAWICGNCRRQHLHRGSGICTRCRQLLPVQGSPTRRGQDYYSWKATEHRGRFRLNSAELTGQTDKVDAQSRQARFQGVFLDEGGRESRLADGIDLLSVTTTLEAGVDIGALELVVLGNMPPTRFNYQQRVGRAGRRTSPVAVALTVCRGRSHDEYYFARPHSITNEPTPKPYLALDRTEILRRALRSEVLRMAFAELGPQLIKTKILSDLTNNPHGQFGLTAEWPAVRHLVQKWIDERRAQVEAAAQALCTFAPADVSAQNWAEWVRDDLVATIDHACNPAGGHVELSQRLAEAGALPMFGFPTHVRYLHLNPPQNSRPWPPSGVIDRDLGMAVSQFAPLSEVVRDGQVYPVVGVAAFKPVGNKPVPEAEPLGSTRHLAVCRSCAHLAETDSSAVGEMDPCPRCSAAPGTYQGLQLREPLGFRAGRPKDFDGNFSWSARAMAARAMTDLSKLMRTEEAGVTAFSGPGTRYVINDNGGNLHRFRPSGPSPWGGYVSVEAVEKGLLPSAFATGDAISVALGAVQPTDFLFVGSRRPVMSDLGLRLDLDTSAMQQSGAPESANARKAAWYSLAFLLRTAAATYLDVQTLELSAGIYNGLVDDSPTMMAFLADTLENGAGFSTHLGSPDVFDKLMDGQVREYLTSLEEPAHATECSASCYRCLRDYSNMAYHALLDWRLARDLLSVLQTGQLPIDPHRERRAITSWAEAYGAELIDELPCAAAVLDSQLYGRAIVVAKHPLEASETTLIAPRLASALAAAEAMEPPADAIVFADTFTLDRDPGGVIKSIRTATGGR
ncbi:Helicase conserved C-terminal domain-containing protein [Geodermatophilus saharensis]|uniref:Helicase conserved C-terminal domain-containing protein n=1 Tax=Geodermatophilus saharensis TaxID=1137994 RepID=A0A239EF28_9ACTN|nr:DEAD/DEAH box helicase [Geodermatophilus saharensis]SNS43380.1 Helicase conserved C-terminal domain-containing protein [Geodermatophilus saharensis]